jgi:selenoprotein W-related protein
LASHDKPRIEIQYCTQCRWLLRAAWLAQELLTTFEEELGAVTLVPASGGTFEITINNRQIESLIWSRKHEGRFPEAKEVKQRVRDELCPDKSLGHSDVKKPD